ncbi:hypothetical protein P5G49_14890 [Sporosarcina sp. F6_3S_P_2]|uniref:ABC transporter periplasmic binding protein yphF n=2 Tax=Sporosarcina highlanderae TaxID=3035916 RepID=A0ABT8JUD2_9BACL|nr:hypothetical protein [Sporosarcina highlanderae]MDN4608745.1 hypothetical protein [Sporosarcina highlanderae]
MIQKRVALLLSLLTVIILAGCMYPGDEKERREIPYEDQIEAIQKAVNAYKENNGGLLPIKTREQETDLYIKYPIEFSKLVPAYTEKIPSNAFETGGIYQYVLMDVEENPTVKLVDLRIAERIRELNLRKHINGKLPFKEAVGENVYEIDFEAMGFKEPLKIESPYSDALLPIVVGGDGNFYVDYSIDLNRILSEEKRNVKEGEDIRYLLSDDYPIVPAYSLPYTVNDQNEPVFMKKK